MVFNVLVWWDKKQTQFYRRKDCIEKFCKDLKELGTEIINFEEKEMIPLTNKEIKSYEKQKVCHICKEKFWCDKKNSEIIVVTPENLEELLIVNAI